MPEYVVSFWRPRLTDLLLVLCADYFCVLSFKENKILRNKTIRSKTESGQFGELLSFVLALPFLRSIVRFGACLEIIMILFLDLYAIIVSYRIII